ncbi:Trafficking protein particle complex subunit 5 [Gurleya vavrai]
MTKKISSSLFTAFSCSLISNYLSNSQDTEKSLQTLGQKISLPLLQLFTEKRETNLIFLLQNLAFNFLPNLYTSNRHIKKVDSETFVLYEDSPLFSRFVSNDSLFCADAIVAGIIEEYLKASGFENNVEAHLNKENGSLYLIKIKKNEFDEEKCFDI